MITSYLVGGSAIGIGGYTGYKAYQNDPMPEEQQGDRFGRATTWGARAAVTGLLGYGLISNVGFRNSVSRAAKTAGFAVNSYFSNLGSDISRSFSKTSGLSSFEAFSSSIGSRRLLMGGAGAGLGAFIGSQFDKGSEGAVVGGIAGIAVGQYMRTATRIKNPTIRAIAGLAVIGAGLFAAGRASRDPGYASSLEAVPEIDGTYSYDSGVSRRLQLMNANGNIALGLHNRRHG